VNQVNNSVTFSRRAPRSSIIPNLKEITKKQRYVTGPPLNEIFEPKDKKSRN